jgi:hypothetical protein
VEGTGNWIFGGVVAVLGLIGLFVAAHAHGEVFYWAGIALFVFSALLVMATIKTGFDRGSSLSG